MQPLIDFLESFAPEHRQAIGEDLRCATAGYYTRGLARDIHGEWQEYEVQALNVTCPGPTVEVRVRRPQSLPAGLAATSRAIVLEKMRNVGGNAALMTVSARRSA